MVPPALSLVAHPPATMKVIADTAKPFVNLFIFRPSLPVVRVSALPDDRPASPGRVSFGPVQGRCHQCGAGMTNRGSRAASEREREARQSADDLRACAELVGQHFVSYFAKRLPPGTGETTEGVPAVAFGPMFLMLAGHSIEALGKAFALPASLRPLSGGEIA